MHILAEKLAILAAKLGASGQRFESRTRHQSAKSCQCSGGVDQIPPKAKDAAKASKQDLFERNRRSCQARISFFVAIAEDKRRANDNTAQFLLQRKRHWTESQ